MIDSFLILLGIGVVALILAIIGYRRGKVVAVFVARRDHETVFFWYGIILQFVLGIVCIILAFVALFRTPS
jgi:drug/metabolite transporter (DMT)-like permease